MHHASAQDEKVKDAMACSYLSSTRYASGEEQAIPVDPIACWSGKNTASASQPITMYRETKTARIRHEKLLENTDDGQRPDDPEEHVPPGPPAG